MYLHAHDGVLLDVLADVEGVGVGEDAGVVLGVGLALDLHHAALLGGGLGVDGVAGHHRAALHQTDVTHPATLCTQHDTPDGNQLELKTNLRVV